MILPEQLEPRADLIAFICSTYCRVGTNMDMVGQLCLWRIAEGGQVDGHVP